jgi:hypothetical protein
VPSYDIFSDDSRSEQSASSNRQSGIPSPRRHHSVPDYAADDDKVESVKKKTVTFCVDEFGDIIESDPDPDTDDMFAHVSSGDSTDDQDDQVNSPAAPRAKTKPKKQAGKSTHQPTSWRRTRPATSSEAGNNGPATDDGNDGLATNDDVAMDDGPTTMNNGKGKNKNDSNSIAGRGHSLKHEELAEIKAFVDDADLIASRMAERFGIPVWRLWTEAGLISKNRRAVSAWDGFQRYYSDMHKDEMKSTSKRLPFLMRKRQLKIEMFYSHELYPVMDTRCCL